METQIQPAEAEDSIESFSRDRQSTPTVDLGLDCPCGVDVRLLIQ